jgi:hypothetical protein
MIGGQKTSIEAKYVLDLATAGGVIQEWIKQGEESSLGIWERQ